ncbi:hypothetical protein Pst134EA_019396 [Puccinia striiformis f. sp. tritici]|uniref:hypothetical protein n=1 Tax=Puccinia striiformis f. sp. tritici TaxID=168172 RepID=UPI002007E554|nr:hypothetical protein Pst134EA_019396 [Puccinia striiformis f. sp. tritici]KAH9459244.1 hypothetical protein Pst134EA_019396 [Puccinia striiformis f. sp. tritici]
MKQSDQPPPLQHLGNSPGVPSPVDTYFQQLTLIDLEYFKELVPVYSDFDQTIDEWTDYHLWNWDMIEKFIAYRENQAKEVLFT